MTALISLLSIASSCHTKNPIKKTCANKGYFGKDNRDFFHMNNNDIMRKATRGAFLTQYEKERNKAISKIRYIVEQYFGISHLHQHAHRARFTKMIKNAIDGKLRQLAFNLFSSPDKNCESQKFGENFSITEIWRCAKFSDPNN